MRSFHRWSKDGGEVEQLKLRGWLESREMFALTVNIHEQRTDLRQD